MYAGMRALITGGGSGIGRALCKALAQSGAQIAVVDLMRETAEAVAAEIGGDAKAYACDVSVREQVLALAQQVEMDFGGLDLVFANAGVAIAGRLCETDPIEFQWLFDVNVGGVFNSIQAFLPMLRKSASSGTKSRIIITGSENSLGLPLTSPSSAYTASKHALLGMADALQRDLRDDQIAVSIFCPGVVSTQVWDARRARPDRYGGASSMPPEYAERAEKAMQEHGLSAEETVAQVLQGIEQDEFLIITDPRIRLISQKRMDLISAASDLCDQRLQKGANL
jgi:NAD(P)-dependent dehydrogenase (short-subunit alcohol dehydrogenase family)